MHLLSILKPAFFRRTLRLMLQQSALMILFWAVLLNVAFGLLFYLAERNVQDISITDALWWSMVTMTTVGYGDFYAQSAVGRFIIPPEELPVGCRKSYKCIRDELYVLTLPLEIDRNR